MIWEKIGHYPEAAACFFRAARVYPDPMHFMSILNNLLPEDLFQLVLMMLQRVFFFSFFFLFFPKLY